MATGSFKTGSYDGRYAQFYYSTSQSGNVITVDWEVRHKGGNDSWYITSKCEFTVTVTGSATCNVGTVTVLSNNTSRKRYDGDVDKGSFTITLTGSTAAKFSVSMKIAIYDHSYNKSGSGGPWSLPDYIPPNTVRVYNGSSWVKATPYVYNGSKWVKATAYVYNGSKWVAFSG